MFIQNIYAVICLAAQMSWYTHQKLSQHNISNTEWWGLFTSGFHAFVHSSDLKTPAELIPFLTLSR